MTTSVCGILMPNFDFGGGPHDTNGCHLPHPHEGAHEFVATDGGTYQWETDWACDCESCREVERHGDGDYCIIYSEKKS